jgi:hypothetical protein
MGVLAEYAELSRLQFATTRSGFQSESSAFSVVSLRYAT